MAPIGQVTSIYACLVEEEDEGREGGREGGGRRTNRSHACLVGFAYAVLYVDVLKTRSHCSHT